MDVDVVEPYVVGVTVPTAVFAVNVSAVAGASLDVEIVEPYGTAVTLPASPTIGIQTTSNQTVLVVPTPGPPGMGGGNISLAATTAEAISGHMVVTITDAGYMDYASCAVLEDASKPLALTTGAWANNVSATATLLGVVTEPSWNWTPGLPIYLGDNGLPTQTLPGDAVFSCVVAEVISPTSVWFAPQTPIKL